MKIIVVKILKLIPLLVFCNIHVLCIAKLDTELFKIQFKQISNAEKILLIANYPLDQILSVKPNAYELTKEYKKTISKPFNFELNQAFEKIETEKLYLDKKFDLAITVSKNNLSKAQTIDDSITWLSLLKNGYLQKNNIKLGYLTSEILYKIWNRKSKSNNSGFGRIRSIMIFQLGLYNEALDERRNDYLFFKAEFTDSISYEVSYLNDLGIIHLANKSIDSSLFYLNKALNMIVSLKLVSNSNYKFLYNFTKGNLGQVKYYQKRYTEAIDLLNDDASLSLSLKKYNSAFSSFVYIAKSYYKLNDYKKTKIYLDSSTYSFRGSILDVTTVYMYYQLLADVNLNEGKYKDAAKYYKEYISLKDSIEKYENTQMIISQEVFSLIKKSKEDLKSKELLIIEKNLEQQKTQQFLTILLLGIIAIVFLILYLLERNINIKKREVELEFVNKKIEKSLKEKELLLKEIHHRVKNNLQIISSMINLQFDKISDPKTIELFEDTKNRINAIAQTHSLLYTNKNLAFININDFIESLVANIKGTYLSSSIKVHRNYNSIEMQINIDTAVPLGLIVNEIITNAMKHAFKNYGEGIVSVNLKNENSKIVLVISDNGKGFSPEFDYKHNNSLGLNLIHLLTEQIGADLTISNLPGATFTIVLN